ncbi:MAG TPA: hydrogenase maturation protease [Nitrospiraceae bacterium]|nr:hydrogenase maturation protease [Nitrospiraceae bacterium]
MLAPIRIIGIGNGFRGDDAVGLVVARRLRGLIGPHVQVAEAEGPCLDLLDLIEGAEKVVLVDAASGPGPEGQIHRFDATAGQIGREVFPTSTHTIGLAEAIEIGRALGRLPAVTLVYGIEIGAAAIGSELSLAVSAAVEEVAARILGELSE